MDQHTARPALNCLRPVPNLATPDREEPAMLLARRIVLLGDLDWVLERHSQQTYCWETLSRSLNTEERNIIGGRRRLLQLSVADQKISRRTTRSVTWSEVQAGREIRALFFSPQDFRKLWHSIFQLNHTTWYVTFSRLLFPHSNFLWWTNLACITWICQ